MGLLGLNGAGKSTLMRILSGYLTPCSGAVFIDKISIVENPSQAQKYIGYLPEHNPLYMDMYIKEYLYFVADLHKVSKKNINTLMQKLGLQKQLHQKIKNLSKGYRQRVGLAATLIHDPKILLLDEPTTGLDPSQLEFFRSWIKDLSKEKTIVFSTHILQEIVAICNRIIVLKQGKIIKNISLSELPTNNAIAYLQGILVS